MQFPRRLIVFYGLWLALSAAPSLLGQETAEWEKILKSDARAGTTKVGGKRGWTYGLQIDTFSRIESSGTTAWEDILRKDARSKEVTLNDTPAVRQLIDEMAAVDAQMDDKDEGKADAIGRFGLVFADLGDFSRAQQLCLRGFRLAELNSGPDSAQTLRSMARLDRLFILMGDFERVQMISEEALAACARNRGLGPKMAPLFLALRAQAESGRGFYRNAAASAAAALEKARTATGCSPLVLTAALLAQAQQARMSGDYAKAEEWLQEALRVTTRQGKPAESEGAGILSENCEARSTALQALGELQLSRGDVRALEKTSTSLADSLKNNAGVYTPAQAKLALLRAGLAARKGDQLAARAHGREYLKYVEQTLPAALGMVESQRLGWQKGYLSYAVPVSLCAPEELADYVLKWKGIVLDSMIGDRKNLGQHRTEAAIAWSKELNQCRQKLLQASMSRTSTGGQGVQELQNRVFFLERKIAEETRNFYNESAVGASASKVRGVLGSEEALVEFITYRDITDPVLGELQVGAVVLAQGQASAWIPLGPELAIVQMIRSLQTLIPSTRDQSEALGGALADLYRQLWANLRTSLPAQIRTVYVCPDGLLNFVPFACLLDPEGRFLGESHNIVYVGSGRDLLTKATPPANKDIQIFASPDFGGQFTPVLSGGPAALPERSLAQAEFDRVALPPLPGTEREAEILSAVAARKGWSAKISLGREASEAALAGARPPGVLHLATHGFYLGGHSALESGQSMRGMAIKQAVDSAGAKALNLPELNPMIQSGIALAGALRTLGLWSKGDAPEPANDGILTAQDVAGLDLKGTWLVTLSACETGVGEAKSGEGVFGLKRAFMMAGTQNLLLTLWPVSDAATPQIMGEFYGGALSSGNAPAAFGQTQREWLVRLKKEKGLHAAVREAGPFAMVAMANTRIKSQERARSDEEILEHKREESRRQQRTQPQQRDFDHLDKLFQ